MSDDTMDRAAERLSDAGPHPFRCDTCTAEGEVDGTPTEGHALVQAIAGLPVVGIPAPCGDVHGEDEPCTGAPHLRSALSDAEVVNARGAIVYEFPCPVCGTVLQAGGDQ